MVLLPALGLLALVVWFLNKYLVQPYLLCCRLRRQGVRGAPYRPFIGQLPEMQAHIQRKMRDPDYAATMFRQSLSEIDKYGETHMSQLGPNIDLLLSTPEAIKEVLVTKAACFQKPGYIKKVLSVMGNGLVVSEGSLWERQRRMINPAFNHKEIKVGGIAGLILPW
jgi:cytochrome P450